MSCNDRLHPRRNYTWRKKRRKLTAGTTLSSIRVRTEKTEELGRLSLQMQISHREISKKQKNPKTKTTPDITLQLALKPVPHYHTCIICVANTPSTPCESVNLLNDYCHSFNASDLLICCFQEKIVSPRPVFAL